MRAILPRLLLAALLLGLAACASRPPVDEQALLAPSEEQLKLRNMQTRTFEVASRKEALRGIIAALQDLGFIIERANEPLGLVTAARFAEPRYYDVVGVTVTARPQAEGSMLIRANAIYNNEPVTDPEVYRNFFATLERALFVDRTTQ